MYLHLGRDTVVHDSEVVGIFDIDRVSPASDTRNYLKAAQKADSIVNITDELPASFVVCRSGKVYISQISAATLKKRAEGDGLGQND